MNGTAELTKSPEQLRLQLKLFAKGPDIASARTQLGAVQKDAASQLVDIGADKESITSGPPIATVSNTELEVVRPVQLISNDVLQSRQEPLNYRFTVNAVFRLEIP